MNDKMPRMEPSSDHRRMANFLAQFYKALLDEGFTPMQALYLTGKSFPHGEA
jgi:hypothetical protein